MEINLNLKLDDDSNKNKRVKEATKKREIAKYEPTWNEVWLTGYTTHTGSTKKGILQSKLTETDRHRLMEVKSAIESNEIGTGVESLRNFTKTKALALYKDLKEVRRDQIIADMVANMPENYHLIDTLGKLDTVLELLQHEELIALDTETTGVEVFGADHIVGLSMSLPKADYHCYLAIRHNFDALDVQQLPAVQTFEKLKPFLEDPNLKKVLHNAKFDFHMLRKEGIEVAGLEMDTMVAMHLLNENEPSYALKNLATKYGRFFGFEDKSMTYEELFGRGGFENTPLDIGTVYACKDTHLTYKFYCWIMEQFNRVPQLKKLYYEIEKPITEVCVAMEKEGFLIDLDFAEAYKKELQQEIETLNERIQEGFGDININSNQQLANVIYEKWKVKDEYGGKVDAQTLKKIVANWERLKPEVAYIRDLLKYRELNKLLTTYVEPLPQKISEDGRLHGSFNQSATVTGRFASNNPNLQNLPYNARKMFVAPEGKIIVGIDYSQIEPRFLAHISQDKAFMSAYIDGRDLYSEIASSTFKKPIEECGDGSVWRKKAKVVLLGNMYGISAHSLADQFGITLQEAEQIYIDFLEAYPRMAEWFRETNDHADQFGFVETAFGRKRRFIGHTEIAKQFKAIDQRIKAIIKSDTYDLRTDKRIPYNFKKAMYEVRGDYGRVQRMSINARIQGSSADIMKVAMIRCYEHLQTKGSEWKMLGTIHDEILFEIPATATKEEIEELADVQRQAVTLTVPMKVDVEVSKRWGCGVSFAEYIEKGVNY